MAQKNNNIFSILFSSTPNFLSQVIFGAMIMIIASMLGASLILSLFLGIVGGFSLGFWFTSTDESTPSAVIASNDGIDAGLKYWLFFILGFTFLGYPAPISILLGGIGAMGGGWVIAWWRSKEETKTQLSIEELEIEANEEEEKPSKKSRRKTTRRFRRPSGSFSWKIWER